MLSPSTNEDSPPPSTDCSTSTLRCSTFGCLSLLRFCWSYSLEFTTWQSTQSSCWTRPVSTESENPPVCLLLAFRRGVFKYSRYTNVHLLTYLFRLSVHLLPSTQKQSCTFSPDTSCIHLYPDTSCSSGYLYPAACVWCKRDLTKKLSCFCLRSNEPRPSSRGLSELWWLSGG